jgi:large subunit ribosomal protein L31
LNVAQERQNERESRRAGRAQPQKKSLLKEIYGEDAE